MERIILIVTEQVSITDNFLFLHWLFNRYILPYEIICTFALLLHYTMLEDETMKRLRITQQDYIKANRKASREEEIALHGKPLPQRRIHSSKKTYNRQTQKAGIKNLLFCCP